MHRFAARAALALALVTTAAPAAWAQRTLADALRRADAGAFGNRAAAGNAAAAAGQALAPLRGILPSVRLEGGYVRTTDPIGAFGATLRQRAISPADFDPQHLNYPAPIGNYQAGVVVEQPLWNGDAWAGRRAARFGADATRASAEWARLTTRVDVVRAWYGAVLARERAATLEVAARAAHAHVAQAEAMVRQGLVTRSDALLAAVRAGDVDAQLAEAEAGATLAVRQLAVALGGDGGAAAELSTPPQLPSSDAIRAVVAADTLDAAASPRADLLAATRGAEAARADLLRARSAYLPRLNSFARYDWNSAARLYAGDRNWTVGVMATWAPFAGASELAELRSAGGRASAAQAQADAASAQARLDLEQTRSALGVALARLAIAERSAAQSAEAHRIVSRKYEGGLATVTELLDAQAAETGSALALSQSRYGAIVAAAERRRALGRDPGTLAALDAAPATTAAR